MKARCARWRGDRAGDNPDQVEAYRNGKATLIGWFVGQVMRQTGGKADPQRTRAVLEEILAAGSDSCTQRSAPRAARGG